LYIALLAVVFHLHAGFAMEVARIAADGPASKPIADQ